MEIRSKHFYTEGHNFSEVINEVLDLYLNKVLCADSSVLLKKFPDNCIDLIFTSPPYNFGMDYESTQDEVDWKEYFKILFTIFDECVRVLKFGGRFIINVQPTFSHYVPTHHIISNYLMQKKMIWRGEIIWEKNNYNCKYTAWGSWKSCSNPYLKYTWEFIEVFCKGTLKKEGDKELVDIDEKEFKELTVAKWVVAPEHRMKEFGHVAVFPERLVEKVLKLFSYKNDIVLDPMNGVGSMTYVANKFHRKYIGIDISEEYCKTARKRMDQVDLFGTDFNLNN